MTSPTPQEFWNASNAAYSQTPVLTGWQLIESWTINGDGFHAAAFENQSTGNVIVAYEGSILDLSDQSTYAKSSRAADSQLARGLTPAALQDAITFVQQVRQDVGPSHPIYVTGHSLGGTEAEAAVAFANSPVVGGMTFGATGLPGFTGISANPYSLNLVDYVDYGDWVGNYARDSLSELRDLAKVGSHVGTVRLVGTLGEATNLQAADRQGWLGVVEDTAIIFGQLIVDHPLENYAIDLIALGLFNGPPPPILQQDLSGELSVVSEIAQLAAAQPSPTSTNSPHPIVTGPSNVLAITSSGLIPLSSLFVAAETPAGSSHQIDHYSIIYVRGPGSIILSNQPYSTGSVLTNVSRAEFATTFFSAGANAGVSEFAVVAFDDAGISSNLADATITVTAPLTTPQPINPNDHTSPTIVAGQLLVTGVGSNPTLTAAYLQTTDSNSAHYTASQLTYTITSGPAHGYLLKGGSIVSAFTQADVNNGLLEYQENGTIASNDNFSYYVSDPAGNRSPNSTFNITINAPSTATHPTLDTNSPLSVGQGLAALVTASNLHVTDSGLNPWQIIYTVTGGATHGQILADGVNVVHSFTQQQVDLGLISYRNTGNSTGPDNLTFTVSDSSGGAIGQTTFGINVIPHNNLQVTVERPLYNDPGANTIPPSGNYIPWDVSALSTAVLTATDQGVNPTNKFVRKTSNAKTAADKVVEFVAAGSDTGVAINKVFLKETEKVKYRPSTIVKQMRAEGFTKFNIQDPSEDALHQKVPRPHPHF
jgi:hypothetical protein